MEWQIWDAFLSAAESVETMAVVLEDQGSTGDTCISQMGRWGIDILMKSQPSIKEMGEIKILNLKMRVVVLVLLSILQISKPFFPCWKTSSCISQVNSYPFSWDYADPLCWWTTNICWTWAFFETVVCGTITVVGFTVRMVRQRCWTYETWGKIIQSWQTTFTRVQIRIKAWIFPI